MEAQMLKDKVAVITGASYGMGQSMAERKCSNTAAIMFISPVRNVIPWIRHMPACIWRVRWAGM